ncbi:hypothetical protein [Acerihabitans arboris]|uniref:Uncharacterized protein n=1 Tax=Acerihabitans arboris TaxID=2691583 RepID=A0A845SNL4_9GAMM|nr:hypothetical protein [Acerihabitans arboris]NDL64536.1 hypothetical protein [Acerihabitans arboris]
MSIPASNFMSASIIDQPIVKEKSATGNNTLAARVTGVKNDQAAPASAGSPSSTITRFLGNVVSGLVSVGNRVGRFFGIKGNTSQIMPLFATGIKIAQYGVATLLYEVMSLMREQALPILDTWLRRIIDDGGRMTPLEVFSSLIAAIRDNEKIKLLFHDVVTA